MAKACPIRKLSYPALALLLACARTAPTVSGPASAAPAVAAVAAADPYHQAPLDTVEVAVYRAWQQYMLQCSRCHGEEAQGSSFGPSLVVGLKPGGNVPTPAEFLNVLINGRKDKGMPTAAKMGVDSVYFDGLYRYLKARSDGQLHGGRPARRES